MAEAYPILWSPNAIRDLDEIVTFTADNRGADAAEQLYLRIVSRVERLSTNPKRARLVPELLDIGIRAYRELILSPYRILFRVQDRVVAILGILDGRRDLAELLIQRATEPFPFE